MRIAVVGSYGAGLTMQVPRFPVAGETLSQGVFAAGHGGKGSNQAVAAARLGARVSLLTAVGDDQFGREAHQLWAGEGVDASRVRTVKAATMVGFILVEEGGENRITIAPGALDELTPEDVEAFGDQIRAADLVVVSLEIPLSVALAALRLAHEHGVRTLLNPAPATRLPDEAWPWVDVLTPNAGEALILAGRPVDADHSPEQVAGLLRRRFDGVTVLTLGERGALIDDGDDLRLVPPIPPRLVVDTTGAGDAFTGALAVALTRGDALPAAVRYATAAGSHAVGVAEVVPALPRPGDLEPLLAGAIS